MDLEIDDEFEDLAGKYEIAVLGSYLDPTIGHWQRILERDGYKCVWCGSQKDLQADHIIPVARGGKDEDSNLRTLCSACNRKKLDKLDHEIEPPIEQVVQ